MPDRHNVLEVFVAMVMTAFWRRPYVVFAEELKHTDEVEARRVRQNRTSRHGKEVTRVLRGARISDSLTDTNTFFQSTIDSGANPIGFQPITFTTTAPVSNIELLSTNDYATSNNRYRPGWRRRRGFFGRGSIGNAGGQSAYLNESRSPVIPIQLRAALRA